jgi:hypothetical protein
VATWTRTDCPLGRIYAGGAIASSAPPAENAIDDRVGLYGPDPAALRSSAERLEALLDR